MTDPHKFNKWRKYKHPYQLLRASIELCNLWEKRERGLPHFSRFPVSIDMTNSSYQIMAGITRDWELATATNLVPSEQPQDIYSYMLVKLFSYMERGSDDPIENAKLKKIAAAAALNRNSIKQTIMTLPYGVTDYGIIQQLRLITYLSLNSFLNI